MNRRLVRGLLQLGAASPLWGCGPSVPPPVARAPAQSGASAAVPGEPAAVPNPANADPSLHPSFGPYDVQTVFFIEKSDDHNRVDYGMRLDSHCKPVGDNAVFPYWREFEHAPPVRTHTLKFYEYAAYGFSQAHAVDKSGADARFLVELKQVARPISIVTGRDRAGHCSAQAYATIQGHQAAHLDHIFVQLAGVLSVSYVDVYGSDRKTGKKLVERMTR